MRNSNFCSVCKLSIHDASVVCNTCNRRCHLRKCSTLESLKDWSSNFVATCCRSNSDNDSVATKSRACSSLTGNIINKSLAKFEELDLPFKQEDQDFFVPPSINEDGGNYRTEAEKTLLPVAPAMSSPAATSNHAVRHRQSSSSGRAFFSCNLCDLNFESRTKYYKHKTSVHTTRPYLCHLCPKKFVTAENVRQHLSRPHGPHRCTHCNKVFKESSYLIKHLLIHNERKPYRCDQCGMQFRTKCSLRTHIRSHSGLKPLPCSLCDRKFIWSSNLKLHLRTHAGLKLFKCQICHHDFTESGSLKRHMQMYHTEPIQIIVDEESFNCEHCGRKFKTKSAVLRHLLDDNGVNVYKCAQCNKICECRIVLRNHKRSHTVRPYYDCPMCGKRYLVFSSYEYHVKSHYHGKSFSCNECGKEFSAKNVLQGHMLRHSAVKPHKCGTCYKSFHQGKDLKQHLRTHTNEKPFPCDICELKFRQKSHLTRHKLLHNRDLPFKCYFCKVNFLYAGYLKNHNKMYHSNTSNLTIQSNEQSLYRCTKCSKCFVSQEYLNMHMKKHVSKKRLKCNICCRLFYSSFNFDKHMRTHKPKHKPKKVSVKQPKRDRAKIGNPRENICNSCSKNFPKESELLLHLKMHALIDNCKVTITRR